MEGGWTGSMQESHEPWPEPGLTLGRTQSGEAGTERGSWGSSGTFGAESMGHLQAMTWWMRSLGGTNSTGGFRVRASDAPPPLKLSSHSSNGPMTDEIS